MIIVFNSVPYGAMLQYAAQLVDSFIDIGREALLMTPFESDCVCVNRQSYKYVKTINIFSKDLRKIINAILTHRPEMVICSEDNLLSSQIILLLKGKVKTVLSVHDAKPHPSYNKNLLKDSIRNCFQSLAHRASSQLMFLSDETLKQYIAEKTDRYKQKSIVLPLGAHVPNVLPLAPPELHFNEYILFFGRIDKYKGVNRLLSAFEKVKEDVNINLVIAGKGVLSDEEQMLTNKIEQTRIQILNRFIYDEEMLYLFQHSKVVCLPYIEASQSGVIPMAYHFGKPVIVSDLPGLTQFVKNGETGYVFKYQDDLELILKSLDKLDTSSVEISVEDYYRQNLNWENNLSKIFYGKI